MEPEMNFHTRKWVKPEDLNPNQSLFGGKLLQWIDEESALYAVICRLQLIYVRPSGERC